MIPSKFAQVVATVEALEAAAKRAERFKKNLSIRSAHTPCYTQVAALHDLFRRMKISRLVTAKVGAWRKRLILTDVIINYHDMQTKLKDGEEARIMAHLMIRAMNAVKAIIQTVMPGMTGYCPEVGIVDGYWRYQ